jgi:hypothetical protein
MMLDLWLRSPSPLTQGRSETSMSETSMSEPDRTIRRPDRNVSADSYRYSEFTDRGPAVCTATPGRP